MHRENLKKISLVAIVLLFGMVFASLANAQGHSSDRDSSSITPSSPSSSSSQNTPGDLTSSDQQNDLKVLAPHQDASFIHILGQAAPVSMQPGYIKLGPLSMTSVDFIQSYDQYSYAGTTNDRMTSVLRTHLLYSKTFKRNTQVAFQYAPQVFLVNGRFFSDFSTQNVSLDTVIPVSRRLTIHFADSFRYSGNNAQYLENGLAFDSTSGFVLQNNWLERPGNWISNDAHFSMNYQLGFRNRITITPDVGYMYTNQPDGTNRGRRLGGEIGFIRSLSPRTDVGISYAAHMATYDTGYTDSLYQNVYFNYAHTFGRGWQLSSKLGVGTRAYSTTRNWTPIPVVSLVKQFRTSAIAVAYQRTDQFYGQLNNGYNDQFDVSYTRQISRNLSLSLGAGKYGQIWTAQRDTARYGRISTSYRMFSSFYSTLSYMYRTQSGSSNDLLLGQRNLYMVGISWIPGEGATR